VPETGFGRKYHPGADWTRWAAGAGADHQKKGVGAMRRCNQTMEVSSTERHFAGRFHANKGGRVGVEPWAQVIVPSWLIRPLGPQGEE